MMYRRQKISFLLASLFSSICFCGEATKLTPFEKKLVAEGKIKLAESKNAKPISKHMLEKMQSQENAEARIGRKHK